MNIVNLLSNIPSEVEKARLTSDSKKLLENEFCMEKICFCDVETVEQNSAISQALLQYLKKVMQERTKVCSVTSLLSKRGNVNSNCKQ